MQRRQRSAERTSRYVEDTCTNLRAVSLGQSFWHRIDHAFDTIFSAATNPWRHLGALGFLFLWIVVVSGIYVYIMFDTSVADAYESIESLSRNQPLFGGLLRSLHRYASDAFLIVTLLHLLREFMLGRYRGFRAFSWLTGVPLLWLTYAAGIGGFWLVWDQLGQFSANATAELLDAIPLFATPLTRNFLTASAVSDRMFSLFVFVHIGVPLLLLFGLWFHIQRISQADVFPARGLSAGTLTALLILSLVLPVTGQGAADMAQLPPALSFDWWYLAIHSLMYATSATTVWVLVFAITALLLALPVLPTMSRKPAQVADPVAEVAVVSPDNCSGCRRCLDDCPYAAISMVPHPNRKIGRELAVVNTDFCAACGICAGSCPSSSPFRHNETLVTGIDMPQLPVDSIRRWLNEVLADETKHDEKIIVIGCDHAIDVGMLASENVATCSLICTGQLPPAFVEYAIRRGAAGVLLTGCRSGGCAFRQGNQWTGDRIAGRREPHLRSNIDPSRVNIVWADRGDEVELQTAISQFKYSLLEVSHEPNH
jgi:quinol-cytochrome oxidoreductase complex cytochrome b subunit/coenzyme F420-reducing hydrogenase delta subunit